MSGSDTVDSSTRSLLAHDGDVDRCIPIWHSGSPKYVAWPCSWLRLNQAPLLQHGAAVHLNETVKHDSDYCVVPLRALGLGTAAAVGKTCVGKSTALWAFIGIRNHIRPKAKLKA